MDDESKADSGLGSLLLMDHPELTISSCSGQQSWTHGQCTSCEVFGVCMLSANADMIMVLLLIVDLQALPGHRDHCCAGESESPGPAEEHCSS